MLCTSGNYNAPITLPDSNISAVIVCIDRESGDWRRFFVAYDLHPLHIAYEDIIDNFSQMTALRQ